MESPPSPRSTPRCRLCRTTLGMFSALALAWRMPAPPIALRVQRVRLARSPQIVLAQLRTDLVARAMLQEGDVVVAAFAGTAGSFRYETVELIRFFDHAVTFEHLRGPFRRCDEVFVFLSVPGGGHACEHRGTFVMRGGILGWLFGILVVRSIFDRQVAHHMHASFAGEHAPRRNQSRTSAV